MRFSVGDRVRVTAEWTGCAGQLGTVAQPDAVVQGSQPGWHEHTRLDATGVVSYWVQMDVEKWIPGVIEAAEIPEDALEAAGRDHGRDA